MSTTSTTAENMKNRIRQTCTEMTPKMLARVRECFRQRILKYIFILMYFIFCRGSSFWTLWINFFSFLLIHIYTHVRARAHTHTHTHTHTC